MKIAVISDIHSNWQALKAVMNDAERQGVEDYWCLGDVVGRGPNPYRCWDYLANTLALSSTAWVAGNHDWGLLERLDAPIAIRVGENIEGMVGDFIQDWPILQGQRQLLLDHSPQLFESLASLAIVGSPVTGVFLSHGVIDTSPRQSIGTYALTRMHAESSYQSALAILARLQTTGVDDRVAGAIIQANLSSLSVDDTYPLVCTGYDWQKPRLILVGHTHIACAWQRHSSPLHSVQWKDQTELLYNTVRGGQEIVWFENLEDQPLFVNPGSVGFPRDAQPGYASYLIADWQQNRVGLTLRHIAYDPADTIRQMELVNTPATIINLLLKRSLVL